MLSTTTFNSLQPTINYNLPAPIINNNLIINYNRQSTINYHLLGPITHVMQLVNTTLEKHARTCRNVALTKVKRGGFEPSALSHLEFDALHQ